MTRLIDADAIKIPSTSVDAFENCRNCNLLDEFQVREIIDSTPTIDAVPVVRCWACEYYRTEKCPMLKEQNGDGFCSFGKVRVY